MIKSFILAKSENGVIGRDNQLPWHLPADLKYFKNKTIGHFVLMGRKTFESMKKPLPDRTNVIITRSKDYVCNFENCLIVNDVQEAFTIAEQKNQKEVFIIGGSEIFNHTLNYADKIYLTEIKAEIEGDTFFQNLDPTKWKEIKRENHEADEKNKYNYSFVELVRI